MTDMRPVDPAAWPFHDAQAAFELTQELHFVKFQAELDRIRAEIGRTRRGRIGLALMDAYLSGRRRLRRKR